MSLGRVHSKTVGAVYRHSLARSGLSSCVVGCSSISLWYRSSTTIESESLRTPAGSVVVARCPVITVNCRLGSTLVCVPVGSGWGVRMQPDAPPSIAQAVASATRERTKAGTDPRVGLRSRVGVPLRLAPSRVQLASCPAEQNGTEPLSILAPTRPVADPAEVRPDASERLRALLATRLVFLDGAMGTVIQQFKLGEADYRGARFADWGQDLKGNNDLLSLTQPEIIAS